MSIRNSIRGGVLLAVVVGLLALAPSAFAQISLSVHDLNTAGPGGTAAAVMPGSQICVACHTPHNGDTTVSDAPLWNHSVANPASFTPYPSGGTMQSTPGQPSGVSLLCLSCHDGSLAVDAFGGGAAAVTITGVALLNPDLSNDHPISLTYDGTLGDPEMKDPAAVTSLSGLPAGGTVADDMLFGASNDQLECASCHDVHNSPGTVAKLLRKANTGSQLCLTCHIK